MTASGHDPEDPVLADINVTPLVDVMLVLLIIFMVTAPMLHQGIAVALPQADAQPLPPSSKDPLIISIKKDGTIYLRDAPVHATKLVERLRPMLRTPTGDNVFLRGDRDVPYGNVIEVLEVLRQAGIVNVGMVTEPQRNRIPSR